MMPNVLLLSVIKRKSEQLSLTIDSVEEDDKSVSIVEVDGIARRRIKQSDPRRWSYKN